MSDKFSSNQSLRHTSQSIVIMRQNLIAVCSVCVKTILDKACFQVIDESSLDLQNFLNIIEAILFFQLKGNIDNKRNPYTLFRQCATNETRHLFHTVESLEKLTHYVGKFRASLRLALMHKCLYQLFECMLAKRSVLELHYFEDSVLRCPTAAGLFSQLAGLAALDLSFDLRCDRQLQSLCYPRSFPVDYATHMQLHVLQEAKLDDQIELAQEAESAVATLAETANTTEDEIPDCRHCDWRDRYLRVESQLKRTSEQKSYLEEMNSRLAEERRQAVEAKEAGALGHAKEIALYESVVLELQVQLTLLQEQYNRRLAQLNNSVGQRASAASSNATAAVGDNSGVHAGDGVTRPRLPQLFNRLDTGDDRPLTRVSVNDDSCELESQEFDEDTVAYRTPLSANQFLDRDISAFGYTDSADERTLRHLDDFAEFAVQQQPEPATATAPVAAAAAAAAESSDNSSSDLVKLDSACDSAEVIPSDSPQTPEDAQSFGFAETGQPTPQRQDQQQDHKRMYYTLMPADATEVASPK